MTFVKAFYKKKDLKLFSNYAHKTKLKTKNTLLPSTTCYKTSKKWSTSKKTTWSPSLKN